MSLYEDKEREKQDFLNYLDQHGVLDQITDVLIMLYNETEKPADPTDYVRRNMCADNPDVREIAAMESLLESTTAKLVDVRRKRDELRAELERSQPVDEDGSCSQRTSSVTEELQDAKHGGLLRPDDVREEAT